MKDSTRSKVTNVVVGLQWSNSAVVVASMLSMLIGVQTPDWLGIAAGWYIVVVGCPTLVVAMALCFTLPDDRRWVAVVVSVVILSSGVFYLHHRIEVSKASETKVLIDTVKQSPEWITQKAKLDAANASLLALSSQSFDQDHPTARLNNLADKAAATATANQALAELKKVEASAPVATVSTATAFAVFGDQWSGLVAMVFLIVLAVGDQAVAFALKWPRTAPQGTAVTSRTADDAKDRTAEEPHRSAATVTLGPGDVSERRVASTWSGEVTKADAAEYLKKLRERRAAGEPCGYRSMMTALDWSEARVRGTQKALLAKLEAAE